MSPAEIFQTLVMTIWALVCVLGLTCGYFLYRHIGYARIFKEPGERGRWTGPFVATICALTGFILCLIFFK